MLCYNNVCFVYVGDVAAELPAIIKEKQSVNRYMTLFIFLSMLLLSLNASSQTRYLKYKIKSQKQANKIIGTTITSPLTATDGTELRFNKYRGRFLVVDFWFTKCYPCFREFPYMDSMKQYFKSDSLLTFINICSESTFEEWQKVVAEKKITGINLFDNNPKISQQQFIGSPKASGQGIIHDQVYMTGYPSFAFIDSTGKLLGATSVPPSDKLLFAYYIDGLLKNQNLEESLKKFVAEIRSKHPSAEFLGFVKNKLKLDKNDIELLIETYRKSFKNYRL